MSTLIREPGKATDAASAEAILERLRRKLHDLVPDFELVAKAEIASRIIRLKG